MKRLSIFVYLLSAVVLLSAQSMFAQLSGTKTIPGDYATITLAVADLNAVGVGAGGVTFNVAAGYTETIASVISITATGTAANPIVFQKSGAGANPLITGYVGTTTPGSATHDDMWRLVGSDYVTIDGIDLTDPNTTNPASMEGGYVLYKASLSDGAQNNTIKNCVITLNRVNNATGSGPSVEGSRGIEVTNATPAAATTALVPITAAGTNSNNRFYTNTIQNCNYGIVLSGYAASTPFTAGDTGNDIGGSSVGTGNTIRNFGGGAATNPAAAIRANNQWSVNISYNTINNNDGGGVNHATTLRGIYGQAGTSANATINNNTITIKSAATTSAVTAIENAIGSTAASNTVTLNNNTITGCTYTTATTGTFSGILQSATAATTNISGNTVTGTVVGLSGTASSATFQGIYNSASNGTNPVNINNNVVTNNVINNQGGTMYCIRASTCAVTANGDTITGNSFPLNGGTLSASLYGYYNFGSPTVETYNNNVINNLTVSGNSSSTSSLIRGIYSNTSSSSVLNSSGNVVNTLTYSNSSTGACVIYGISYYLGAPMNVFKNKIYDITANGASSTAAGLYIGGGTTVNVYNNIIGDIKTPSANAAIPLAAINVAGGTTVNLYYNTAYLNATSTGALFGSAGVYASTSPTLTMRNNVITNLSTPVAATGYTAAYRRTSTTLTTYASASDNNDFYAGTPGVNNLIFFDGTNSDQTVAAYKTRVSPRDASSFSENPTFVSTSGSSANFLHINTVTPTQIESGGTAITGITDDYDGDTRNVSTPDIGADEFSGTGIDLSPPSISYTALSSTGSTSNRTLATTIGDATGVGTGAGQPLIYFRKGSGGTWQSAAATTVVGSAYTFTISNASIGGVTAGDTVQYYVAAQDIVSPTPNSGTNPGGGAGINPPGSTPPPSPNSYVILYVISSFPYSEDFEGASSHDNLNTGGAGWSTGIVSGSVNDWVRATPAKTQIAGAHGGVKAYVTLATGTYNVSENAFLQSPIFDFSGLGSDPTLGFWQNFKTELNWDAGVLEYSTNGGSVWLRVDSTLGTGGTFNTTNSSGWYNNSSTSGPVVPPKWSGTSTAYTGNVSGWTQSTTSLVGLAGKSDVRFRWRFGSDGSGVDEGWAIDDVSISIADVTPPAIVYTALNPTYSIANRNLTATITDGSGVAGGGNAPRIYYRKGTSGVFTFANAGTIVGSNYTFTIDHSAIGAALGDTVQYYVAAQDVAGTPNVATNPGGGSGVNPPGTTAPASPNSYKILSPISAFPYAEGFEAVTFPPEGWTNTGATPWVRGTGAAYGAGCAKIVYSHTGTSTLTSPQVILPASHRISFWWKDNDITIANDRPTVKGENGKLSPNIAAHDTTFFEVSTDGGSSWTMLAFLSAASSQSTYSQVIQDLSTYASANFYFRFRDVSDGTFSAYGTGVDSIRIEPLPAGPPDCVTYVGPADAATGVSVQDSLRWTAAGSGGAPTGYKLYFGTDNPPTNLVNGTDIGLVLSYNPPGDMLYNTLYYWKIVPTNGSGDATGCLVRSFTTQSNPNFGGGGGTSGGYYFANSTAGASGAPSQPTYSWIDPVAAGHTLVLDGDWTGGGDDGFLPGKPIGFTFTYFGTGYTTVYLGTNGWVTFSDPTALTGTQLRTYVAIPTAGGLENYIGGAWRDLDARTGTYADAKVYYGGDAGKFVATFMHVHSFGSTTDYITFQIILYANNNVKIQYNDVETTIPPPTSITNSCTVGLENSDGTLGVQYRYNGLGGPMFSSPVAVEFGLNQNALPIVLSSFTGHVVQSGGIRIDWTTTSETNNYGFYVQRRLEGTQEWGTVSSLIPGYGTTLEPHSYSYTDHSVTVPGTYQYRLRQMDLDGTAHHVDPISVVLGVTDVVETAPREFSLKQNYPNPFNPETIVKFSVENTARATLDVYNVLGQKVASLFDGIAEAGQYYKVRLNGSSLATGMYIYRLQSGTRTDVKKMLLLK